MYEIGDMIVYGGSSCVCRIEDITALDIKDADKDRLYYKLKPLHQDCVIYNPVDNTTALMRPVITKYEADRLIDMIPEMDLPEVKENTNCFAEAKEIAKLYESIIKTRDCAKLIGLTMSIYLKKQSAVKYNRKFGSVDAAAMKRAEDILFGELSVALGIPKENVREYIEARINEKTANC
ncbi:hypothetical protein FACS1894216_13890 [Synergistales bacterium]|nr:hypothetical protein FACS1894216_13890 [Synergistales bacterium]